MPVCFLESYAAAGEDRPYTGALSMAHHPSADPAKQYVLGDHGAVATRRYSPVVRLGTLAFWTLIAGLLVARLLIPDPNKTGATDSAPQAQTSASLR
jgi:hypothetical protein